MSCAEQNELYVENDVPLLLETLINPLAGNDVITDASVTVDVEDSDGNAVGATIVLVYDQSIGAYYGVLPHTTPLVVDERYTLIYTATLIDGTVNTWRRTQLARVREI